MLSIIALVGEHVQIPREYHGREQTYLKHQVLRRYLQSWGYKLGSGSGPIKRIWFVDCFAGPWRSEKLQDNSPAIALDVLNRLIDDLAKRGQRIAAGVILVQPDAGCCEDLRAIKARDAHLVDVHIIESSFEDAIPELQATLRNDAALIFVDPTGWRGAGMDAIAELTQPRFRDVMINFMTTYVRRFAGDDRRWLEQQMCEFFGIDDNSDLKNLGEEALLKKYRDSLREATGLKYALELAIPHPTDERTFFHLVVAAAHHAAVELLRNTEARVLGAIAAPVREAARQRKDEKEQGQIALPFSMVTRHRAFESRRDEGLKAIDGAILDALKCGPRKFLKVWPHILEHHHVRRHDVSNHAIALMKDRRIMIEGFGGRKRKVDNKHLLSLSQPNE